MGKRRAAPHGRRLGGAAPSRSTRRLPGAPPNRTSSDESGGDDDQMEEDELSSLPPTGTALPALGEKELPRLVERYAAMGFHLPAAREVLE